MHTQTPPHLPTVGLVVVNYRSSELTDALLAVASGGADEVVVVDCTPGDPGLPLVAIRHGALLVEPGVNLGYGAGANLGARQLATDVIIVANPDVEITGADLRRLAGLAKGVGVVAPLITYADGRLQPSAHRREPGLLVTLWDMSVAFGAVANRVGRGWNPTLLRESEHASAREVSHVLGALLAIDATAFAEVGGFDPDFFMYREETDLCRRLRAAGWSVQHEPSVVAVHHLHGTTPGAGSRIPEAQRLRSHYRYIQKHWGRGARLGAQAVGALAAATSVVTGPDRRGWLRVLGWHMRERG